MEKYYIQKLQEFFPLCDNTIDLIYKIEKKAELQISKFDYEDKRMTYRLFFKLLNQQEECTDEIARIKSTYTYISVSQFLEIVQQKKSKLTSEELLLINEIPLFLLKKHFYSILQISEYYNKLEQKKQKAIDISDVFEKNYDSSNQFFQKYQLEDNTELLPYCFYITEEKNNDNEWGLEEINLNSFLDSLFAIKKEHSIIFEKLCNAFIFIKESMLNEDQLNKIKDYCSYLNTVLIFM